MFCESFLKNFTSLQNVHNLTVDVKLWALRVTILKQEVHNFDTKSLQTVHNSLKRHARGCVRADQQNRRARLSQKATRRAQKWVLSYPSRIGAQEVQSPPVSGLVIFNPSGGCIAHNPPLFTPSGSGSHLYTANANTLRLQVQPLGVGGSLTNSCELHLFRLCSLTLHTYYTTLLWFCQEVFEKFFSSIGVFYSYYIQEPFLGDYFLLTTYILYHIFNHLSRGF